MSAGSIGQQIINGTYGLDNRPPTAYEELIAWCEKHLAPDEYKVVPESSTYYPTIYFDPDNNADISCLIFDEDGAFQHSDTCTNEDMCEHIRDLERENPPIRPNY